MKPFRVLQFNMQFGQGWDASAPDDAPVDLDATLAEIRRHDADIILLQEVEQAGPAGVQVHPPINYTRLRRELNGFHSTFGYPRPDPRELPFGIGLAIFSKTPLSDEFREDLPSPPIEFEFKGETRTPTDRLLIGARTTIGGRGLAVVNTHLLAFFMLNSSSEFHRTQRDRVLARIASLEGAVVLGGDFNVSRHESLVDQFASAGFKTVQQTEVTWRRRPYVLDHIFHSLHLRCVAQRVEPTPASDHHVVVADFVFAT